MEGKTCHKPMNAPHGNTHASCVEMKNTAGGREPLHRAREPSDDMENNSIIERIFNFFSPKISSRGVFVRRRPTNRCCCCGREPALLLDAVYVWKR